MTFLTPEAARQRTQDEFTRNYENEIAIALKEFWPPALGRPTDERFQEWARQLIDNRQITTNIDGTLRDPPFTIDNIQTLLGSNQNARNTLRTRFGTENLNEIIMTRSQVNATAQQLGQATFNNRGSVEFLGGATFGNLLAGLFEWIGSAISALFSGRPVPGFSDTIARHTTHSMATNANTLLAQNVPSLNAQMRQHIVTQYGSAVNQEAGLIPRVPPRTLESVALGSGLSAQVPAPAPAPAPPVPAPAPAAGAQVNPQRLQQTLTQLATTYFNSQNPRPTEAQITEGVGHFTRVATEVINRNPARATNPANYQALANDIATALANDAQAGPVLRARARASHPLAASLYPDTPQGNTGLNGQIAAQLGTDITAAFSRANFATAITGNAPAVAANPPAPAPAPAAQPGYLEQAVNAVAPMMQSMGNSLLDSAERNGISIPYAGSIRGLLGR